MKGTLKFSKLFFIGVMILFIAGFTKVIDSEQALLKLKEGNIRFINNERTNPNQDQQTLKSTFDNGQFPFATIVSCSDSRVPVEHVFDVGFGDVFVVRVAGNVVDIDEAGTIEYGVEHLHTPLLVIMGHTKCGAVTAVCKGDEVHGNIPKLVDNIVPAVNKAKEKHGEGFSHELVEDAIINNVWQSIEDLMKISPISAELVKEGKLKIVGSVYHLDTGVVEWLGEHPDMNKLLKNDHPKH